MRGKSCEQWEGRQGAERLGMSDRTHSLRKRKHQNQILISTYPCSRTNSEHGGVVMSVHSFGGAWTERKLSVVRRYLEMYAQALKNQAFQRVYIDAFAGTGDRTDKRREAVPLLDLPEFEAVAKGSARLALEVEPPFHRYVFIERASHRASELTALKSEFPLATSKSSMPTRTMRLQRCAKRPTGTAPAVSCFSTHTVCR